MVSSLQSFLSAGCFLSMKCFNTDGESPGRGHNRHKEDTEMEKHHASVARRKRGNPARCNEAELPPASQLDPTVLDALPLELQRELRLAYGTSKSPSHR
eukprot:scaffold38532_cov29-Prasinocladus_malaysianus.AAC.4